MTILEKGRYCESCEKTVIDFTNLSRQEIIRKLEGKKEICGRLYASQLTEINSTKSKTEFYLAKWAMLLRLGSILGISEPVLSQNIKPKIELQEKSNWKSILPKKAEKDTITIKGKVTDLKNNFPLAGVNIIFKGTSIGTQTDFDGKFSMKIPTDKLDNDNYLVFTYIGFETKKRRFYKEDKSIDIKLKQDPSTPEQVVILGGIMRQ
jgi:hypothetical protein